MLFLVARHQASIGCDHSPPGEAVSGREHPAHSPGRTHVARLLGHLAVCGDFPGLKCCHDGRHAQSELAHVIAEW